MERHNEHHFDSYTEYSNDEDLSHKKKIRRQLEERLERKRLKEEFMDEFDELTDDFDWSELEK